MSFIISVTVSKYHKARLYLRTAKVIYTHSTVYQVYEYQ